MSDNSIQASSSYAGPSVMALNVDLVVGYQGGQKNRSE